MCKTKCNTNEYQFCRFYCLGEVGGGGGGITIKIGLRDWKVLNIKCNKI